MVEPIAHSLTWVDILFDYVSFWAYWLKIVHNLVKV